MIISALSGFIMVLTFCFSVGDIESALSSPTGQPYIQVFYNATNSRTGTTVLTVVIATMTLCNTINNVASASRQLYAFARDRGLPFASTLSYVSRLPPNPNCCLLGANMSEGQTRLAHSLEFNSGMLYCDLPFVPYQHRQRCCLQRHRVAWDGCSVLHLCDFHLVYPRQKMARGAPAAAEMELREVGSSCEWSRDGFHGFVLLLQLLAVVHTYGGFDHELEYCNLWCGGFLCGCLLPYSWEIRL